MLIKEPELDKFVTFIINYLNNLDPHDVEYYLINDETNSIKITTIEFVIIMTRKYINVRGLLNTNNNFTYIATNKVRKHPYKKLYNFAESRFNKQVIRIDDEYNASRIISIKNFINMLLLNIQ